MLTKIKIVISVIMLGLFLRITFIFLHPYPDINDAYQYDLIATNIMNGYGISQETKPPYIPQIDRVPFYPIFYGIYLFYIRSSFYSYQNSPNYFEYDYSFFGIFNSQSNY